MDQKASIIPAGEIEKFIDMKRSDEHFNAIFWFLVNRCEQTPQIKNAKDTMCSAYFEVQQAIGANYVRGKSELLKNAAMEKPENRPN